MSNILTIIILLVLAYNLSSNFKEFVDGLITKVKHFFVKKKEETRSSREYTRSSKRYSEPDEDYGRKTEDPFAKYTRQQPTSLILEALMDMGNDFKDNQYTDKIDISSPNHYFVYKFENGSRISISTNHILTYQKANHYNDTIISRSASVSMSDTYQFLDLITHFSKCSSKRDNWKFKQEYNQGYKQSSKPSKKYTEEQLKYQEQFRKLKEINDRRMEQLDKMSKTDPDRVSLVNEVNVVKRKMKDAFEKSGLTLENATR